MDSKTTKIVAFSDVHGNTKSFEEGVNYIKKMKDVSAIMIAGDLADYTNDNPEAAFNDLVKMFQSLEKLKIEYYFVLGNWDMFFILGLEKTKGEQLDPEEIFQGILKKAKAIRGTLILRNKVYKLNEKINITSDRKLVNRNTIYLVHADKNIISDAFLHVEGHWGLFGQINLDKHYLNLGFLHGGKEELTGCIWEINIEGDKVRNVIWHNIGRNLKEITCSEHKKEGLFVIPSSWKKCPVCYRPERARFSKEQGRPL